MKFQKIRQIFILIPLILCGCSGVTFSDWRFPYMMEVQQGSYITKDHLQQIKVGMSKDKVAFMLGYPLSQYLFDKYRWDYNYQDYKNNKLVKSYVVTLYFDANDNVKKIEKNGDELFSE